MEARACRDGVKSAAVPISEGEDDLADLAAGGEVGVGVGCLVQGVGGGEWHVDVSGVHGWQNVPFDLAGQQCLVLQGAGSQRRGGGASARSG